VEPGKRIAYLVRLVARPFGYLAFALALAAMSGAAWLLGEAHELGFFSERLSRTLWRYPEVTRRGVQMAWLTWVVLFCVAVSPFDPFSTRWDEIALGALALAVLWRRLLGAPPAGH
jgi:hypothetical protein